MAGDLSNHDSRLYVNTVVFTVVAAIITVALLVVAVAVPAANEYKALLITVEVGLLAVVFQAVLRINTLIHRRKDLLNTAMDNVIPADTCPDYFTAVRNADGSRLCKNVYESPRDNVQYSFVDRPNREVPDHIQLRGIDGKNVRDMCKEVDPTDPGHENYNIPWTELRAKCRSVTF